MTDCPEKPDKEKAAAPGPAAARNEASLLKNRWLAWGLLALVLLALGLALAWDHLCRTGWWGEVCYYYHLWTDREKIQGLLKAAGPLAPLIFILVQALQVVLAPIPGEATGFIGGFLFGVPLGLLYSTLGLTLGSMLAFLLGRWLEHRFVERWVSREILDRFDYLMEHQGAFIAFFLFLIPGLPKDFLCFILGLSLMDWRLFLVIVTIGRIPGTLMLTLQGAKVYEGHYLETVILVACCLVLAGVMYYFRDTLHEWLKRWGSHEACQRNRDK